MSDGLQISDKKLQELQNFYREFKQRLYVYARTILNNAEDAEDAVHAAFAGIIARIQANGWYPKNLQAFVYRSVHNAAIDRLRSRRDSDTVSADQIQLFAASTDKPDDMVRYHGLNKGFARLKPADRRIIVLKVVGELSFKEISGILDMSLFSVATRYYRGIGRLRKELEKSC